MMKNLPAAEVRSEKPIVIVVKVVTKKVLKLGDFEKKKKGRKGKRRGRMVLKKIFVKKSQVGG
jgi:hypothetical protein